jgi:hypothetical protein
MSMRSIIVGAFATSVILFTGPLALASHCPQFFPLPGRFGPFGIHHRATTPGCTPWQSATKIQFGHRRWDSRRWPIAAWLVAGDPGTVQRISRPFGASVAA